MRMPNNRPAVTKEVVEKDIFRFEFILQSGKKGQHYLFDSTKLASYLNDLTDEDQYMSIAEKAKYGDIVSKVVYLPNLPAKREYIEALSFTEQRKLFHIYLSMVDQYQVSSSQLEAN